VNPKLIEKLLKDVSKGSVSVANALASLKTLPYEELEFATIDSHRSLRRGFPEVIYGEGKSSAQLREIAKRMSAKKENVLITRLDAKKATALKKHFPSAKYDKASRTFFIKTHAIKITGRGTILVITAGTSDIPVAEEAALTAEYLGNKVERLYDVGVAGLHRLLHKKETILAANVLIVVAGMEGALPSVISGLVARPVIAVPTSIGYGANLGGLTTLMAMLTSCSSGVSVVNIDNGFGAAYAATLINRD
jgi:hypothetical protein